MEHNIKILGRKKKRSENHYALISCKKDCRVMTKGMLHGPKPKSTIAESMAATYQTKPNTLDHTDELVIFRVNPVISENRLETKEMRKNDGHEERGGPLVITTVGARPHAPEGCRSAGPADDGPGTCRWHLVGRFERPG